MVYKPKGIKHMAMTFTKRVVTETKVEFTFADALKLIATSVFVDFTKNDWMGYSGCESKNPMIAKVTWNSIEGDVVLDGDTFEFHFWDQDDGFTTHVYTIKAGQMDYQVC